MEHCAMMQKVKYLMNELLGMLFLLHTLEGTIMKLQPTPSSFLVNGYIHLTFYPLPLIIESGQQATGLINVTVENQDHNENNSLSLHMCCQDDKIVALADKANTKLDIHLNRPGWFVYNITLRGVHLGSTKIRFYITKKNRFSSSDDRQSHINHTFLENKVLEQERLQGNIGCKDHGCLNNLSVVEFTSPDSYLDSNGKLKTNLFSSESIENRHPDTESSMAVLSRKIDPQLDVVTSNNSNNSKLNSTLSNNKTIVMEPSIWWVIGEYEIVVRRPEDALEKWLDYVVIGLTAVNMIAVGGQMDVVEALYLIKRPTAISVAMLCRFAVLPALGLGLADLMQPGQDNCLGVLTFLCSPHEGSSCLLILLAELDLTLSVTLMCVINFATVAILPLWMILFETRIYETPGNVNIPFQEIFIVFGYIASCVVLGYCLQRRCPKGYHKFWIYLPAFTTLTVLVIISVEIYKNLFIFQLITVNIFFMSAMLAISGYIFGAALSFIIRQPVSRISVIMLETGCRTTYTTSLLLDMSLQKPFSDIARTTPVLAGLLTLIPGLLSVLIYRGMKAYGSQSYAGTECTLAEIMDDDLEEENQDKQQTDFLQMPELIETSM